MAKVYLKFNGAIIKEHKLTKEETLFGRKPTNDIVIGHPTISGFHGKIRKDGEHFIVEDLNSTNGTFLNGQPVKSAALKNRDKIGAAGHILEFVMDDAATPSGDANVAPIGTETPGGAGRPPVSLEDALKEKEIELLTRAKPELIIKSAVPAPPAPPSAPAPVEAAGAPRPKVASSHPDHGVVRMVSGGVDGQTEVVLKELVTYIGTTDQAAIKIKGFLAPSLAAAISRRAEGYYLKAVKAGYPKVNGNAVNEQILLDNGASIEVGGTNMVFYDAENRKKPA